MTAPSGALVRVPASSANLGPGYDCFGLALARYDEVSAVRTSGGVRVDIAGVGEAELPRGVGHLVVRAAAAAFATMGEPMPGLRLSCRNTIPHSSGQGSSAAAIVSGVLLARALTPDGRNRLDDAAALRVAADLEGHPDNVAPALSGGFTLAFTRADGTLGAVRRDVHPDVRPVLFTAAKGCATTAARSILPASVPHADAARTAAAAGLLVHALTCEPTLLFEATRDWLHQPYRAATMPDSAALIADLRAAGIAAVLSGAGPSVLALTTGHADLRGWARPEFAAARVAVAARGAVVTTVPRG